MTIVTSTLRMQLDAGGFVKSAAQLAEAVQQDVKRIDQLKAALRDSGASDRLQASMVKLGASTSHVEGMRQALEKMRQEMGIVGVATGKLSEDQRKAIKAFESTTIAVVRSTIAEERNLTAAMARQAVEREAILKREAEREEDTRRRAAERRQADMKRQFEAEATMLRRQEEHRAEAQNRAGFGHYVAGGVAAAVSAHGIMRPIEKAAEAGAERQSALINARRAGMTPREIVRAQDLAVKVSRDVGNMTATEVLELHKEARSAVQHPEEVFELLPDLARAASALKGMGAEGKVSDLVKAGESLGLMGDKERFKRFLDSQVRAQGVMGRTVTTEQTYEAAKYTKSSGSTLSDEFINLTLPSLIQELHGSSAGDAVSGLNKTLRGGLAHQHLAVTQLNRMGLLDDPSKIQRAKGSGEIMGYTGKVKGDALLASDPDQWFLEVWKPAAAKMGAKSMADINMLLSQTLPGKAANLGRIFIQQEETLRQHRENNRNAPGTDEQIRLQREDPKVAVQAFNDALNDLGAAVTGPIMGRVGLGLTDLAGYIRNVEDAALAHPKLALGLGAGATAAALYGSGRLAYLVSTGFGLPAAAGQLSASAAALETAAERIGAGTVASKVPPGSPPGASSKPGIVDTAARLLMLQQAAEFAKDHHALDLPKRTGVAGAVEFLDPGLADRIYGRNRPEARTKDDVYTPPRTSTLSPESYWDRKKAYLKRGFADGGFTGPGSRNEPAGIVHRGEYVVPASATTRHRALLDAIRRGDILPGYAGGGLVGGTGGVARVVLATDSSSTTALREVFGGAVYDALRRIRSEDGGLSGGAGGSGDGGSGSARSLRYGRGGDGTYRSTPEHHGVGGHGGSGTVRGGGHISGPSVDSGRATRAGGSLARNQQEAYRAARAEGLSDVAARALVANMSGESLAKPNDYHYDRTHMSGGIVQWDPARSARIKEHFGKLPWQMSVTDQTRAAVWEMRTRPEYAATNRALQGTDPNAMIGTLVDNYERPQLREKAKRERLGYLHGFKPDTGGTYADEGRRGFATGQREAERAVLPRRSEQAAPEVHLEAGPAGVNLKVAGLDELREAHQHVDALHQKLAGLAGVNIAVKHNMHETTRPGALRTSLNGGYASDGRSWT